MEGTTILNLIACGIAAVSAVIACASVATVATGLRRRREHACVGCMDVIDSRDVPLLDERIFALDVDLPVVVEVFVRSFHDGTQKAFLRCKPDDRANGLLVEEVGGQDSEAKDPAGLEDGGQVRSLEGPVAVANRGDVVDSLLPEGMEEESDEGDANGAPAEVDDLEEKRFRATVSVVDRPDAGLDVVVVVDPVAHKGEDAGGAADDADKSADDADPCGESLKCGLGFHAAESSTGTDKLSAAAKGAE